MIFFLANGSFEGGNARIIDKNLKNSSGYHLSPDNLNNNVSTFNGNSSRFVRGFVRISLDGIIHILVISEAKRIEINKHWKLSEASRFGIILGAIFHTYLLI